MPTESVREEAVDALLAQLLRQRGIPERRTTQPRRHPDIRYELPTGKLVPLECKCEAGHADLLDQRNDQIADFPDWLKQEEESLEL